MMGRITKREMEMAFRAWGEMHGHKTGGYEKGNYVLDKDIAGYQVQRIVSDHGGVDPIYPIRMTAGELYTVLQFEISHRYQEEKYGK